MIYPLLFVFGGALAAALAALPWIRRYVSIPRLSYLLALAPLSAFAFFFLKLPDFQSNMVFTEHVVWLPSVGMTLGLYVDSLTALFALLISFIGILVIIYSGQYFKNEPDAWRFFAYILLFMGAMLGLVMAGDLITLFVFWEGTSLTSFLLVAYKFKDRAARQGAFKALFITGGGGIALLAGFLIIMHVTGDSRFLIILNKGDLLRESSMYPVILALLALGAFTKSAQFPFHIWLPDAMSAPTPASAYLHSATMVKAGIYLMARLNPVLGQTESWFWLLSLVGLTTMLVGAIIGLLKKDLKAMLAYSTVCQLGVLMMMIGQDVEKSFKALVVGILAHALYKSALFLTVGIVDHEAGTRDIDRLGGLRRAMPFTFAIAFIAALSMAGLPPLFGFLAKETLLATAVHPSLPEPVTWLFILSTVITGAFMLAIAGRLVCDVFTGLPRDPSIKAHEAPFLMLAAPAVPALLSLILGQLPGSREEAALLANAAGAAYGAKVKVSLALWTGLHIPLLLSVVAVSLGTALYLYRFKAIAFLRRIRPALTPDALFENLLSGIDAAAGWALRLQQGKLRFYLMIILGASLLLILWLGGVGPEIDLTGVTWPNLSFTGELRILRMVALFLIAGASLACVLLDNDFFAILAFGASGLGVAVLMALEPAPDVAFVQIVVDILLIIILVLALSRMPETQLKNMQWCSFARSKAGLFRDALIAAGFGGVVTLMAFAALIARPRESLLTPFFENNTFSGTGSYSIVGAIITDFRGLDTLVEITVFAIAGLGVFSLMCVPLVSIRDSMSGGGDRGLACGIPLYQEKLGPVAKSPLIRTLARFLLPLSMVVGFTHLLNAHLQPGDGFTSGVIISIGLGFWYIVFGYQETRRRLTWIRPSAFIGYGLLLAILTGVASMLLTGRFFSSVDFGKWMGLPLPGELHLSASFLFETAIGLSVFGSVTHMLNTFGYPEEGELKWNS